MKKTVLFFRKKMFVVSPSADEEGLVCIYKYFTKKKEVKVIAKGKTLKEACKEWLKTDDRTEHLFQSFEVCFGEDILTLADDAKALTAKYDEFIESLSGERLFRLLGLNDGLHQYVDWTK